MLLAFLSSSMTVGAFDVGCDNTTSTARHPSRRPGAILIVPVAVSESLQSLELFEIRSCPSSY